MLKLETQPRPNVRVDLPGDAFIEFKALATAGLAAGRAMVRDVREAGEADAVATVAFTIACARWGAVAWGGVGDEAAEPLELNPANVQLLLEQSEEAFFAVQLGYIWPALAKEAEKNVSAPARGGTSRARQRTTAKARAPGAARSTAKAAAAAGRKPKATRPPAPTKSIAP